MNTNVMQQAEAVLGFWEPESMWHRLIERDLDANDMESLSFHVKEASAQMDIAKKAGHQRQQFDLYIEGKTDISSLFSELPEVSKPKQ